MEDTHAKKPRILVVGTGSIGIVYSLALTRAEADLTCLCRSNYAAAKAQGFTVHSIVLGEATFHPRIVSSVEEIVSSGITPFDYIVVAAKAIPPTPSNPSIASVISPLVFSRETALVLIQNGIGVEREYRETFPDNPIISCVTYLPAAQSAPGVVVHSTKLTLLRLGVFPVLNDEMNVQQDHDARATTFASLVRTGGVTVEVYKDIQVERWRKLVVNASWSTITALSRCRDLEFLRSSPVAPDVVRGTMEEVVAVAKAAGYGEELGPQDVTDPLDRALAGPWPGNESSMLRDAKEQKPMEVEAIAGEVMRLGKEYGVPVPRLECLYALTAGLNWSQGQREARS